MFFKKSLRTKKLLVEIRLLTICKTYVGSGHHYYRQYVVFGPM